MSSVKLTVHCMAWSVWLELGKWQKRVDDQNAWARWTNHRIHRGMLILYFAIKFDPKQTHTHVSTFIFSHILYLLWSWAVEVFVTYHKCGCLDWTCKWAWNRSFARRNLRNTGPAPYTRPVDPGHLTGQCWNQPIFNVVNDEWLCWQFKCLSTCSTF